MADIAICNVRKSYGRTEVIHGVDVDIADGEFVVILGPSGCGKSTLLRMVAGLERITSGTIEIAGRRVNDLAPRDRGCAMVFQNYALYPHMTVAENIGYALKVSGVARRERRRKVEETAAILGLGGYLGRKPSELSGGQRQRVAMGRAIIREPQVFLFDEPLSNLDAKLRVQMRVEIRRLHRRLGATSIFVTHDQVEAMTLADRLIVMNDGLVEQAGRPAEVYDRPATRFVGEFIGSPPMAFVSARIGEPGRLRLPGGGSLPTPPGAQGLSAGDEVHAGIRAENLLVTTTPGPDMPGARVDFFEELGPARLLHLDLAGTPLVAQVDKTMDVAPGSTVGLTAQADHVHLFDPASGRVLAAAEMEAARAA